jgi:hypothetical protein
MASFREKLARSSATGADGLKRLVETAAGPAAPKIKNAYNRARGYYLRAAAPSKMSGEQSAVDWSNLLPASSPFMQYSTCSAADILHPRFVEICREMAIEPAAQRKIWEYVYIAHQFEQAGVLRPGARGIGFGVGIEPLPVWLAAHGCDVVATDAPTEMAEQKGWRVYGDEFADSKEKLYRPGALSLEQFNERVSLQACDMNAIGTYLVDFDFCWSACAFEHLGSLRAGMDFVINSLDTLRAGGVAIHTTEFNLSSNDKTFEGRSTVIYRKRDLDALIDELRARGHEVAPLVIAPESHPIDKHIDVPPYSHNPHLRLSMAGYVTTSAGLVIRKSQR